MSDNKWRKEEVDLEVLLTEGEAIISKREEEAEKDKAGGLRGGNSGAVLENGTIVGKCPNLSYLRQQGISTKSKMHPTRPLMFEAGHANEDLVVKILKESWDGEILRESEIPTAWLTVNQTRVTGSPDIVLCREGTPVKLLEEKAISSLWTALNILNDVPSIDHCIQLTHYLWALSGGDTDSLPADLHYTNRVDFAVHPFGKKKCPKSSPFVEYNQSGDPKKVLPFRKIFNFRIKDGDLYIRPNNGKEWKKTILTVQGVLDYYENVSSMSELLTNLSNVDIYGNKLNYSKAGYCDLGSACCQYNKHVELVDWVELAKEELKNN